MLYYDRIKVSEGIDVNNASESKEWDIFTIDIFYIKALNVNHTYAVDSMISMIYKH